MSAQSPDNAISSGKLTRVLIYAALFLFRLLLPAAALRHAGQFAEAAGRNPPGRHAVASTRMDNPTLAHSLVDSTDRRAADRPQALFHQFNPHGRARGRHLHGCRCAQWLCLDQMEVPRLQSDVRHAAARLFHSVPDRAHSHGAHARVARHGWDDPGPDPRPYRLWPWLHHALLPQLL